MAEGTVRLTTAQAIIRYLNAQFIEIDGVRTRLCGGGFGIFGHGNVTCLGEALERVQEQMPTWRGQNEQSMALAGIAYAKAKRRQQIMIATSSIGPQRSCSYASGLRGPLACSYASGLRGLLACSYASGLRGPLACSYAS